MDLEKLTPENTPARWKIIGKYIVEERPEQFDKLNKKYKDVLKKSVSDIIEDKVEEEKPSWVYVSAIKIESQDGSDILEQYSLSEFGTDLNLKAFVSPEEATNKSIVFESSDDDVAQITEVYGLVKLINPGIVTIIAKTCDGSNIDKSITFEVTE